MAGTVRGVDDGAVTWDFPKVLNLCVDAVDAVRPSDDVGEEL